MPSDSQTYTARWILPAEAAPLENATIEICDGKIAAIVPRRGGNVDLGEAILVPGLINVHTHLEFSGRSNPIEPSGPFTDWIRGVIRDRAARRGFGPQAETMESLQRLRKDLLAGLGEAVEGGATTIGEIATYETNGSLVRVAPNPDDAGPRVVAFRELIGLRPEQRETQLQIARRHLETATVSRRSANGTISAQIIAGLSPHAPYSVHPELFHDLIGLAVEYSAPLAMHLGETAAELELLASENGEFVSFLAERGIWQTGTFARGTRILDYLRALACLPTSLAVHGNYLDAAEIDFLAENQQVAVVYCPRTHAYFQHPPHPWRELLSRGARVVLGTDSRASNPDLSLFHELKWLAARADDWNDAALLDLVTGPAARALGMENQIGSLRPGQRADLIVVQPGKLTRRSLFGFDSRIRGVMVGGRFLSGINPIEWE